MLSDATRARKRAERLARRCTHCAHPGVVAHGLCVTCYDHMRRKNELPSLDGARRRPEQAPRRCWHCEAPDYRITTGLCGACYEYRRRRGHLRDLHAPVHPYRRPSRATARSQTPQERLAQHLLGHPPQNAWQVQEALWAIEAALPDLDPRLAFVLTERAGLRGGESRTLQQIAHVLGVTRSRAHQLERDAIWQVQLHQTRTREVVEVP